MPRWTHGPPVQFCRAVGAPDVSSGREATTSHTAADVCALAAIWRGFGSECSAADFSAARVALFRGSELQLRHNESKRRSRFLAAAGCRGELSVEATEPDISTRTRPTPPSKGCQSKPGVSPRNSFKTNNRRPKQVSSFRDPFFTAGSPLLHSRPVSVTPFLLDNAAE